MHNDIQKPSLKKAAPLLSSIISVTVSAAAAAICLATQSEEPLETLAAFFIDPFTNTFYFGNMLDQASLILLCAMGFILPAKAGFFNLGGEGQAYLASFKQTTHLTMEMKASLLGQLNVHYTLKK